MNLIVAKFGGTSVADYHRMQNCVAVVSRESNCRLVVTSAPAGVTNHLVDLGKRQYSDAERQQVIRQIREQLAKIVSQLQHPQSVQAPLDKLLTEMQLVAENEMLAKDLSLQDELLSFGERFASLLLTQVFVESGTDAREFDIRDVMQTDNQFGSATPDVNALKIRARHQLSPFLKEKVVVTQGFIGRNTGGQTTTLGRGGSDYSAALLSEALDADRCDIWTDVAGVYSTDPRIVPTAFPIPELSYDEAAEMANFGAKVLHPATLRPTLRNNIPVFVGASNAPESGGTTIVKDCQNEPTFRALTRRCKQQLVTLHSPKLERACGFIGGVFQTLDRFSLSVDLITTSEMAISLTLNDWHESNLEQATELALLDLKRICRVEVADSFDLITVIGNHLDSSSGVHGRIFEALGDIKVRLISYGANPHNISFLVAEADSSQAIQLLHKHLLEA